MCSYLEVVNKNEMYRPTQILYRISDPMYQQTRNFYEYQFVHD